MITKHPIHKYFQTEFERSGIKIFRCGLLNCTHFVYEPLIVGRLSICWRCSSHFVITKKTLRAKKFHCEDCTRGKYNKIIERKNGVSTEELDEVLGLVPSEENEEEGEEDEQ